ncbi:MAG: general secretion pathway protein GspK [Pseudomonadota bacterium]
MGRARGLALVLVLWVLALLGTLAMGYSAISRTEVLLTRNTVDGARLRAAAEAGVALAVMGLGQPDALKRWRSDGTPYAGQFDGMDLRVAVLDEMGRIDLNEAGDELIGAVLSHAGVLPDQQGALLAAILDFRDEDHEQRLMGAEDDDYRAMGLPYGAKDGDFEDIEELRLVPGMTPEIYERLRPLVTVHSGHGGVNPWVAGRDVLLALPGATAEAVDAFLVARDLSAMDPGGPPPPAPVGIGGGFLTRRVSPVHVVRVEASIPGGAAFRLEAVIRLHRPLGAYAGRPYEVLSWEEEGRFTLPLQEGDE